MEIITSRKSDRRAILRWTLVVACGLCGLLFSLRGGMSVVRMGVGDGGFTVFFLCLLAAISLPFFLVSYFGALGQYQKMIDVILVFVALLLWAFFSLLISRLEVIKWIDPIIRSEPES